MKVVLSILIIAASTASAFTLPTAQRSDMPDNRFNVTLQFESSFLPVNPALASILHFMSVLARSGFDDKVQPRGYTSPMYPEIVITSSALTEARFLLWGIYLAISDMIKYSRFNNVAVNFYWNNKPVGQLKLTVATALGLPGTVVNDTRTVPDNRGDMSVVGTEDATYQAVERLDAPSVPNVTIKDNAGIGWTINPNRTLNIAAGEQSTQPAPDPPNQSLSVDFRSVAKAVRLRRNDVFLSFYAAMLHVAKFPVEVPLRSFESKAPTLNLGVNMYNMGTRCSYGQVNTALSFVPLYMMNEPRFGFKETKFNVNLDGVRACKGSIVDSLLSAG